MLAKSERRIRVEGLLQAKGRVSDIALAEGISRQRVSQIKRALGLPPKRTGRRPSRAFAQWLAQVEGRAGL